MTRHLPRLDSIRGIGAFMVGGFHAGVAGGSIAWILSFFFDGRTGVCIFFVLSGLVLGMSLRRSGAVTPGSYLYFCGRRFFRLYPAYFFSTLFYLALFIAIKACTAHGLPVGHGWCDYYFQINFLSWAVLFKNFCFLDQSLNVASWTLKVEAQAALVLPLLHAFSLRFRGKGEMLLLFALIALSFSPSGDTRQNLCLFYSGYLIPPLLEAAHAAHFTEKIRHGTWFLILGIIALATSHLLSGKGVIHQLGVLLAGFGATLLLMSILLDESPFIFSFLDNRLIRFFGMVSYSYYLFNLLSVDLVERFFSMTINNQSLLAFLDEWVVLPSSTLVCLILATASFYLIERPGLRLGGHLLPPRFNSLQKP